MSSGEPASEPAPLPEQARELTLKIELPSSVKAGDNLVIPSTTDETLNDLRSALGLLPVTRNLTNYNLFIGNVDIGAAFDDLATYEQIIADLQLNESTTELKIVVKEKAYTLAAVYEQISRFREVVGLHYIDRVSEDFGVSAGVSKLNSLNLTPVQEKEVKEEVENEKKETVEKEGEAATEESSEKPKEEEKVEFTPEQIKSIAELSGSMAAKDSALSISSNASFDNTQSKLKIPIKSLSISQWSPVPAFQKVKGDLLYLTLQTLENETFNITCHFSGFFVNRSSTVNFNPEIKVNEKGSIHKNYLLFNLVDSLSASFSKTLEENEVNLSTSSEHPETYLLPNNSFLATPWIVNADVLKNYPDVSRSQLPLISNGVDGSDYVKDWNEDIQSVRELPTSTIQERILREKLIQKALFDFTKTATETSIHIVKGNLTPMNPSEEEDKHIYLKNGVFYSSGATTVDVFEASGAEEASRYVASKDLAGVKALNKADVSGVNNLVTCIVDYMGKRIVCQAPVPGIFNSVTEADGQEEEKIVYGLSTDGTKILQDKAFEEPLKQVADVFHLMAHKVDVEGSKSESDLLISKDTKGIKGTDGRKYIIDLYRTTPRDIEFTEAHFDPTNPTSYPHGEALLRHEAVAEWWKRKVSVLFKAETEKLEKEGKTLEGENGEKPQIVLPTDQVVFNPDAFSGKNDSEEDKDVVRGLSKFIKEKLIDEFLSEFPSQLAPFDGQQLTDILHRRGINLRYLDEVPSKANYEPVAANYDALFRVIIQEMVARASKHLLRKLSANVPSTLYAVFVAHFHNCLLGGSINEAPEVVIDDIFRSLYPSTAFEFTKLNSKEVIELVTREVFVRFRYTLPEHWITNLIHPVQLLREIAHKFGIQWKAQDYVFSSEAFEDYKEKFAVSSKNIENKSSGSKKKGKKSGGASLQEVISQRNSIFVADDIVNFIPIVKDSGYKASLVDEIFQSARAHIAQGEKETGVSLFNELVAIQEQIYGRVNAETAKFYTLIAQIYSELGYDTQAAFIARKAIVLAERTTGFDSYDTITAYLNAGFYESTNLEIENSLKLYDHAISTWSSVYGRDHPTIINTLTNTGENLSRVGLYDASIKLFKAALDLSIESNGNLSQITGIIYFRLANVLISVGRFQDSLNYYAISEDIFAQLLGPDDSLTKQASKYVSSIQTYIKYLQIKDEQHKRELAQQAAATGNSKVKVKSQSEVVANSKRSGAKNGSKKNNIPQPDPEIASKPIEDILQFIEGKQPKKTGKKAKKSKK
ncbi:protein TIF31 [Scheffersomyces xylosifermentans]|uniref:protein TIF31 n=1 Tax=Scheffersomyces xylosifermentans TaxID=1304137 RepID=UPI00315CBFF8